MAVTPYVNPGLASSYANIQDALNKRADIESKDFGGMGAAAAAAEPLANEVQVQHKAAIDKGLIAWKGSIEDQLNKNQAQYKAQGEGKTLRTQDDMDQEIKDRGIDPSYAPKIPKEGVWLTPEQESDLLNKADRSGKIESIAAAYEHKGQQDTANFIRLAGRDPNADSAIATAMHVGDIKLKKSPTDGLMHAYSGGQDLGPVPGMNTDHTTSSVPLARDVPSLTRVAPFEAKALNDATKEAAKDPIIKKSGAAIDALQEVKKVIKNNNPTSMTNIRARLAQESGGVPGGRFSTTLSSSEGFDPSFLAQLDQWADKKFEGKLSAHNQTLLLQQVDANLAAAKTNLKGAVEDHVTQTSVDAPHADPGLVRTKIAGAYSRYLEEPKIEATKVDTHDPKTLAAVQFLSANGKAVNAKNVEMVLSNPEKYGLK